MHAPDDWPHLEALTKPREAARKRAETEVLLGPLSRRAPLAAKAPSGARRLNGAVFVIFSWRHRTCTSVNQGRGPSREEGPFAGPRGGSSIPGNAIGCPGRSGPIGPPQGGRRKCSSYDLSQTF